MLKNKSKSHHELLAVLQQNHLALLNSGENEFDGLEEETDHYLFTIGLGEKHLIDFHDTFFKKTGTLVRLPWLGKTIDLLNEIIQRIQFVYLLRNAENMQTSGLGEGNDIKNRISDLYFLLIINAGKDSIKVRFVDFRDECEFVDLQKIKILTAQNSLVEKDLPLNFNEHIKDFDGMYSITAREAGGKKSSEVEILLNNTLEEHEVIPEKVIYRGVKIFWNNFIRGSYTHDSFLMQLGLSERHLKDFTDSLESVYFKKNDLTWLIKKEKRIFNLIQRITLNAQNRSIDMIYENIKEKNFDQPLLYITVGMFFKKQVELIRTIHLDFYIIQCNPLSFEFKPRSGKNNEAA